MRRQQPITEGPKARAVIETVIRNRVVPRPIIHRLHFQDCTENAVSQCVRPLREQEWLQNTPIVGPYRAIIPGRKAVRAYTLPASYAANPLPRQPLEQNLGATLYCALDSYPRKRLLPSELLAEFSWFPKKLVNQHPFYFDHENGTRRLAVIRVELSASPYRIIRKHQKQLYDWCEESRSFRKLVDADQFMIVTITTTLDVAEEVADRIGNAHAYPRARVRAWPKDYLHLVLSR